MGKVLHITCWWPHEQHPSFGVFIKEHVAAAQAAGWQGEVAVLLLLKSKKKWQRSRSTVIQDGILVHVYKLETNLQPLLFNSPFLIKYLALKWLLNIAKRFKPDVIHAHVVYPAGYLGSFVASQMGLPLKLSEHWSGIEKYAQKPLVGNAMHIAYSKADKILPVSQGLADTITTLFPECKNKIQVVPNVVAPCFVYKAKAKSESINITAAMNLGSVKRPDLLIEGIKGLPQQLREKISLTVYGEGPMRAVLERQASEVDFTVVLPGFASKDTLAAALQKSTLFVHASTFETFGVVVAEALCTGTPVVCSILPNLAAQISPAWGITCENTSTAWTAALIQALESNYDYAAIASAHQHTYSQEAIGKQLAAIYSKA